jgi:hypothetical protein
MPGINIFFFVFACKFAIIRLFIYLLQINLLKGEKKIKNMTIFVGNYVWLTYKSILRELGLRFFLQWHSHPEVIGSNTTVIVFFHEIF